MSGRNYERLGIEAFGRHLILSNDLDPVYVALQSMKGEEFHSFRLAKWLIAYWCYYNCGVASYLAERDDDQEFWDAMEVAARNEVPAPHGGRWARGSERRHFRGAQALRGVTGLQQLFPESPLDMLLDITNGARIGGPLPYVEVARRTKRYPQFGPWITFKIADMADRVLGAPVDFDEAHVFMFKDPVKAALMLWRQKQGLEENARPKDQARAIHQVVEYLTEQFADLTAPPLHDRPIGLQEVETVLCKWKSHMNGHYPLWNDIDEINDGLEPWLDHSPLAREFRAAMPERKEGLLT